MIAQFHPNARIEFANAVNYYESRTQGLGVGFFEEVIACVGTIETHSDIGRDLGDGVRQLFLRRYPYSVIYCASPDRIILILAIARSRRSPDYWLQRLDA